MNVIRLKEDLELIGQVVSLLRNITVEPECTWAGMLNNLCLVHIHRAITGQYVSDKLDGEQLAKFNIELNEVGQANYLGYHFRIVDGELEITDQRV